MFSKDTYVARRRELCARLKERGAEGIALFLGNNEAPRNYAHNEYPMRQDSSFLYYFGIGNAGLAAIVDIDTAEAMLFGTDSTIDDMIWTGSLPTISEQAAMVGVEKSAQFGELSSALNKAQSLGRTIHYLPYYRADILVMLGSLLGYSDKQITENQSPALIRTVVSQREIKSAEEIEQIEIACAIGNKMHRTAQSMCRPGVSEQEIAGAIEGIANAEGRGVSFQSIVSQHGEILHNYNRSGILAAGRILLVDAGAENNMNYCSDFTRSYPVSGEFTERQKFIYETVERGIRLGQSLARPGITNQSIQREVTAGMVRSLAECGLIKGDVDNAIECGVLGLFMPHGLGHQMGLDVHDMENFGEDFVGYDEETHRSTVHGMASLRMGKTLREGHVFTVEPGLYFVPGLIDKWEREGICADYVNFKEVRNYLDFGGIRLENDILITADGSRVLGEEVPPLGVASVESFMKR